MLNNEKAKIELDWHPKLSIDEALQLTVIWYKALFSDVGLKKISEEQIEFFLNKTHD